MSQGSLVLPTIGTVSGLTLVTDINAAIDALNTANSGSSAPANGTGAVAELGQMWLNTTAAPYILSMYDGTQWLPIGQLDTTNHLWVPPVGGGTASLASATTTDLGSVPQAAVTISGTTTITGFGTSAKTGQIKFITFSGALILTNGAALILPNATNITTAAGDTAVFQYTSGTGWRCMVYQPTAGYAKINSPGFTGTPTAPTVAADTNTTQLATTAYVLGQAASQSAMVAATSATKFPSASTTQYHPGVAKAWVYAVWNGSSYTISQSYNVTSLTRNSTGNVTINLTTAFSSSGAFAWSGNSTTNTGATIYCLVGEAGRTASTLVVQFVAINNTVADVSGFSVALYGTQ